MSTVSLNGTPVEFRPSHRPTEARASGPVLATVTVPAIPLSYDDLVAALFRWEYIPPEELCDDSEVRALIVESVLNGGCEALDQIREDITVALAAPGCLAHQWLTTCRQRVAEVFRLPAPSRGGRLLAGAVA